MICLTVPLAILILGFVVGWLAACLAYRLALRQRARPRHQRPLVGRESLPASVGVVVAVVTWVAPPSYLVRLHGESWSARSYDRLALGDRCLVLEVNGNHLDVCRLPSELEPYWPS